MELPRSRRNVKHCKLNDGSEFEFSQSRYNQFHIGVEGTHERERSRPPSRGSRRYGECHYYSPHTRECNNFGQDFYRQEHPSNNNQREDYNFERDYHGNDFNTAPHEPFQPSRDGHSNNNEDESLKHSHVSIPNVVQTTNANEFEEISTLTSDSGKIHTNLKKATDHHSSSTISTSLLKRRNHPISSKPSVPNTYKKMSRTTVRKIRKNNRTQIWNTV